MHKWSVLTSKWRTGLIIWSCEYLNLLGILNRREQWAPQDQLGKEMEGTCQVSKHWDMGTIRVTLTKAEFWPFSYGSINITIWTLFFWGRLILIQTREHVIVSHCIDILTEPALFSAIKDFLCHLTERFSVVDCNKIFFSMTDPLIRIHLADVPTRNCGKFFPNCTPWSSWCHDW